MNHKYSGQRSLHEHNIEFMAPGQIEFTYSSDDLTGLLVYLSPERLAMYRKAVKYAKDITDRTRKALRKYEYNTRLSEALYPVIQGFEVALRNSVHNRPSSDHGVDWFDTFALFESEKIAIGDAKNTISNKPQPLTPDRIVAELSFGFWVRLFSAEYAETIWATLLAS